MPFVLDASVTLAWLFADEISEYAEQVLESVKHEAVLVPPVWPLEVTNGLLVAARRGRLTASGFARSLRDALDLRVQVREIGPDGVLGPVARLARAQEISSYDASYLYLAMQEGVALATQDRRLTTVAARLGVELRA